MTGWLALLLHAALLAVAAPALDGLMRRAAALRAGQPAPPLSQPWHDLRRAWRKTTARPGGASVPATVALSLASAMAAALLVPSFTSGLATAGAADFVVVAGLLALSRAAPALAAHEAGSGPLAFASGQAMAARLGAAPVLLLAGFAVSLLSGGTNLGAAAATIRDGGPGTRLGAAMAGLAVLGVTTAEHAARAGWSGRDAALATVAGQLRVLTGLSLAAAVALPFGLAPTGSGALAWSVGLVAWVMKVGVLGVAVAVLGAPRLTLAGAALLALISVVVAGAQGAA